MCNTDKVKDDTINIQRLHVHPTYQGQGIGSRLIDAVLEAFPKAKKLQLEVEENNKPARTFYEKRGGSMQKDMGKKGVVMSYTRRYVPDERVVSESYRVGSTVVY